MSRGFIKESDQEEIPLVAPRAYLPEGVTNYVTQAGMDELLAERQKLIDEKESLNSIYENEKRIALNNINARLNLLNNRIDTAQIVFMDEQPPDDIRFGAIITLKIESTKKIKTFQIVGVDEADVSKGKISFLSPLAHALINKKTGDKAVLKRPNKDIVYEILNITYV
ncbi:MAG: GreA/GreB family elongation factor [Dysgonamonadaceae bacterium]|jgi:transcription elongation factor GreB|nr:GreA/GreB family elongation factor [Dysgonamonadaceae bacterium]MDD3309108.1 GreA/GreB family elongation factor [Dysgonamonadaceae bacterium]MDD3900879.1 GreA/GreB family elongation factor [Dysgonamonadaceae bacterium]MDD4398510.1 GreA/GreB family elongation factor [Dysgonamonadaceae bacterium]MEA5081229.1 GreA/GreB family elongation factor [Dysgonamonadaceae bacterium]